MGNFLNLPFNMYRLKKLTENYVTDSNKLLSVIGKKMPLSSKEGLIKTFHYFNSH